MSRPGDSVCSHIQGKLADLLLHKAVGVPPEQIVGHGFDGSPRLVLVQLPGKSARPSERGIHRQKDIPLSRFLQPSTDDISRIAASRALNDFLYDGIRSRPSSESHRHVRVIRRAVYSDDQHFLWL